MGEVVGVVGVVGVGSGGACVLRARFRGSCAAG